MQWRIRRGGGLIGWLVIPSFIVHLKNKKNKNNIPKKFNDFYELIIIALLINIYHF